MSIEELFAKVTQDARVVASEARVSAAIANRDAWRERVDSVAGPDEKARFSNALAVLDAARRRHAATVADVTRELMGEGTRC